MGRIGFQPVMPGPVWDDNTLTVEVAAGSGDTDIVVGAGVYAIIFSVSTDTKNIWVRDDAGTDDFGVNVTWDSNAGGGNRYITAVTVGATIRVTRDADTAWSYTTFKHTD